MNKSELLENYTKEQLVEMVVEMKSASEEKIAKCKPAEDGEMLKIKCDKCREDFIAFLDDKYILCTKAELFSTREANNTLKREVEKLQYENENCRKAVREEMEKCDCQICEYQKKIDDLEHDLRTAGEKIQDLTGENMKLQCERNDYKSKSEFFEVERMRIKQNEFSDFLPTEPIKVADMLIDTYMSGYEKYVHDFCEANAGGLVVGDPCEEVRRQTVSHIQQIAEHLLIYCNANGEGE